MQFHKASIYGSTCLPSLLPFVPCVRTRCVMLQNCAREDGSEELCIATLSFPASSGQRVPLPLPFTVLPSFSWLYEFLELIPQVSYCWCMQHVNASADFLEIKSRC